MVRALPKSTDTAAVVEQSFLPMVRTLEFILESWAQVHIQLASAHGLAVAHFKFRLNGRQAVLGEGAAFICFLFPDGFSNGQFVVAAASFLDLLLLVLFYSADDF